MSIGRKFCATGLAAVSAAVLLAVGTATPASANSSECTVPWGWTTCTTGRVAADPNGHFVEISTWESPKPFNNPICSESEIRWKVVDAITGDVVRRGSGKVTDLRIDRVYSQYVARLDNCPRMTVHLSG
ncbi:hypothetical protein HS041_28890 [Planomonospora sp. ID67723]|uniref:hypothetical protein n=1 Tax=Planomonospora sp. ID67723 TaxID=2738134 RepID=UPI0018C3F28A|nr:hypothetical protein [Planomonospora sp. ID67723]MBG0831740.1 hypothetical protein [Planomonospora sp. ID67723]